MPKLDGKAMVSFFQQMFKGDPESAARAYLHAHGFVVIEPKRKTVPTQSGADFSLAKALSELLLEHPGLLPNDMPQDLKDRLITPIFQTFDATGSKMEPQGDQRLQCYFNDVAKALEEESLPHETKTLVGHSPRFYSIN